MLISNVDSESRTMFISSSYHCLVFQLKEVSSMDEKNQKIKHLTNCQTIPEGCPVITVDGSGSKVPLSKKEEASQQLYLKRI
jgi:hypothetical protein